MNIYINTYTGRINVQPTLTTIFLSLDIFFCVCVRIFFNSSHLLLFAFGASGGDGADEVKRSYMEKKTL